MTVDYESLLGSLTRLKLTAIRDQLDSLLDEAAKRELSLGEALAFLVEREIARKDERRVEMAGKIAHFPSVRELDGFDFAAQPSLDPRQVKGLHSGVCPGNVLGGGTIPPVAILVSAIYPQSPTRRRCSTRPNDLSDKPSTKPGQLQLQSGCSVF